LNIILIFTDALFWLAVVLHPQYGCKVLQSVCPCVSVSVCLCLPVCLFVCLLAYLKKNHMSKFTKFSVRVICGHGLILIDNSETRYVLPVLRMTSCFHIMEPMEQNHRQRYVLSSSSGGSTWAKLCL